MVIIAVTFSMAVKANLPGLEEIESDIGGQDSQ